MYRSCWAFFELWISCFYRLDTSCIDFDRPSDVFWQWTGLAQEYWVIFDPICNWKHNGTHPDWMKLISEKFHYVSSDIGDQKWPNTLGQVQFSAKIHQRVYQSPYNSCQVCKNPKSKVQKRPNMTGTFFNLRVKTSTGGLKWDEIGSIQSPEPKIKKVP